ncbi:MAG TPA: PAS domain S-box protein [Burkholderiales bacterium]
MATRRRRAPAIKRKKPSSRKAAARPQLTSLSSDWYWEQDASLRFVRVQVQPGTPGEEALASKNLGRRPWETGVSVEGGWDAHRALLRRRAPFREVLMWRDLDDGSRRYISVSGEPTFDARGRFTGYRGVGRDITRQKRDEQLLRLQHTVTRRLAEAAGPADGVQGALRAICETEGWDCGELWRSDAAGEVMRRFAAWAVPGVAPAERFLEMSGGHEFRPGEGLIGSVWQTGAPLWIADTALDERAVRKFLTSETGLRGALLCPVPSGGRTAGVLAFACCRIRPPDERLLQVLAALGTQLGLYLRRMDSEARLRESEERFRRTFELAGSGVAHVAMDGRFLRVNRRLCEMFGYAEGELVGRSVKTLSHTEDRDVTDLERARMHRGEIDVARFQKRYLRKDGSTLWAEMSVTLERDAAGTPLYEISVLDDISARKAAEAALRDSEARYRHTFELAGVGVAHIGLDRRFQRVNRRFCEILGYAEEALIGRTGREFSHPEDLDHMNQQRPRLYAGGIEAVRGEKRYLRKDGSVVWVAYTLALERDAAGNPQHEIAVYDDVSARKAAETALRESEARFRSLTELSSDWFWEQDADYRFTRMEGRYAGAKPLGSRCWEQDLEVEGGWDAYRALLEARRPFQHMLMWRRLPDGRMRHVSISGEPVFDAEGRFAGYRGVGSDVTERKRAEQLLQLEHQVARALSEADDVAGGLRAVMRAVCRSEGWAGGRYLAREGARDAPVFEHEWPAGELPAERLFTFPVRSEGLVIGVLAFSTREPREPDAGLRQATEVIGAEVGQFLRRMRAEEALRESEARFRALTEMSSDFYWETDARHVLTDMTYGRGAVGSPDDALGRAAWDIPSTHPDEAGWAAMRRKVDEHQSFRDFEFGRPRHGGGVRYFSVSGEPRFATDGRFLGYRGVGRDITEVVLARERIASLAYNDALTGLANRTSLAPALEQAVERSRRRGNRLAGVFLDLDGFKQINDLYGHDAGDRLLVEAAQRLRAALRSSDPVARLGGDEFFVVLEDLQNNAPAERVAKKLLAALLEPYDLGGGNQARISASIGISVFPDDAGDAATLVKHADAAMYAAKQAGKNAYRFFIAGAAANDVRAPGDEQTG